MISNLYLSVVARKSLSRSVPEIHLHVAGTLSNQQTTLTTVNKIKVAIIYNTFKTAVTNYCKQTLRLFATTTVNISKTTKKKKQTNKQPKIKNNSNANM